MIVVLKILFLFRNDRAKLKRHPSLFSRKSKPKIVNGEITHPNGTDSSNGISNDEIQQS